MLTYTVFQCMQYSGSGSLVGLITGGCRMCCVPGKCRRGTNASQESTEPGGRQQYCKGRNIVISGDVCAHLANWQPAGIHFDVGITNPGAARQWSASSIVRRKQHRRLTTICGTLCYAESASAKIRRPRSALWLCAAFCISGYL